MVSRSRQKHGEPGIVAAVQQSGRDLIAGDDRRNRAIRRLHLNGARLDGDTLLKIADFKRNVAPDFSSGVDSDTFDRRDLEAWLGHRDVIHPDGEPFNAVVALRVGSARYDDARRFIREFDCGVWDRCTRGVRDGTLEDASRLRPDLPRRKVKEKNKSRWEGRNWNCLTCRAS